LIGLLNYFSIINVDFEVLTPQAKNQDPSSRDAYGTAAATLYTNQTNQVNL
jgi:hypothetical protein